MKKITLLILLLVITFGLDAQRKSKSKTKSTKYTKSQNRFVYPTIKIGNIEWGTEDFRITHFLNGDPIPLSKSKRDWIEAGIAKKPIYEIENNNNKIIYRYNFYVFLDNRGVIPKGFLLPTEEDFDNLAKYLKENSTLATKLNFFPKGSKFFRRNNSSIIFDPLTLGFWYKDESSLEMESYDMGTAQVLFISEECAQQFPKLCNSHSFDFQTLYESGSSDAGNGFFVRLVKKK